MKNLVLAADIGGTNSRFRLQDTEGLVVARATLRSSEHPNASTALRTFLDDHCPADAVVTRGSVAICGPVLSGECSEIYALPHWSTVTESALRAVCDAFNRDARGASAGAARVSLVNDFAAMAAGVSVLLDAHLSNGNRESGDAQAAPADKIVPLGKTTASLVARRGSDPRGAAGSVAVVGPGTGWGVAVLRAPGAVPSPSEGGTRRFAARTAAQWALVEFVRGRHGGIDPIVEHMASAQGIVNVFLFLGTEDGSRVFGSELRARAMTAAAETASDAADTAPGSCPSVPTDEEVVERGAARVVESVGTCPRCAATLDVYFDLLAQEIQDTALLFVPTAGLVLAGGVLPRLVEAGLGDRIESVAEDFRSHGILGNLLEQIPVFMCLEEDAALNGAFAVATCD